MQTLVKIGLVSLMLVSGLAAREQASAGNPVTISSEALEITFNGNGGPERGSPGPATNPSGFARTCPFSR